MANPVLINYIGPSMNPTLKAGDILETIPYANSRINVGDIVVFHPRKGSSHVVHRVVALGSFEVKTRGDNNIEPDPYVFSPKTIIGKVVSFQRGGKIIPIQGGKRGLISANYLWAKNRVDLNISRMLIPAYHWLSETGIIRRLFAPLFKPSNFLLPTSSGNRNATLFRTLDDWQTPSRKMPMRIKRPFRLLINEAYLPDETIFS